MNLKAVLEGILFIVGDEGTTLKEMSSILDISEEEVKNLLLELKKDYEDESRGLRISYLGNAFKLTTKEEHKEFYEQLVTDTKTTNLSNAALEVLAVIAYNEPITRIKVDEINKTSRAKKGSLILKSPKSKKYNLFKCFNTGSKTIFGILDGTVGYLKASDLNIMDTSSVGGVFTKKNVDDVFVVSKLKDIKDLVNENNNDNKPEDKKEEIKKESVIEEEPKKKEQLTMSDFFEEFKL